MKVAENDFLFLSLSFSCLSSEDLFSAIVYHRTYLKTVEVTL